MKQVSAGLLLVRRSPPGPEFLLAHPGGPFFAKKDDGAWTIPKGLVEPGEAPFAAACREFCEETGQPCPTAAFEPLGTIQMASGKTVHVWAVLGDCDANGCKSNLFELEWPRGSGKKKSYPELDRFGWFGVDEATRKLNAAQAVLIERACAWLQRSA
jgi:predicted NUDIX family NTP pyrophosphohydrolase